jgi:hypothetical protein
MLHATKDAVPRSRGRRLPRPTEAVDRAADDMSQGSPGSPDAMMAAVTESMRERTGRSLEEWVALVGAGGVDPPASELLVAVRSGPGQSTRKLGLATPEDVTPEVEALLRAAYDQNG